MIADLDQQIKTIAENVKQNYKTNEMSSAENSLKREFSALRKVWASSKSRLRELEAMEQDLVVVETETLDDGTTPEMNEVNTEPELCVTPLKKAASTPNRAYSVFSHSSNDYSETEPAATTTPVPLNKAVSFKKRIKSVTRSAAKSMTKSPSWLPSLTQKKQFFPEDDDDEDDDDKKGDESREESTTLMERDMIDDIRSSRTEIETQLRPDEVESHERETNIDPTPKKSTVIFDNSYPPRPVTMSKLLDDALFVRSPSIFHKNRLHSKDHLDRLTALRQSMQEKEDQEAVEESLRLAKQKSGLTLEDRERSFRTNLQTRALALSRNHSAKVAAGLTKPKDKTEKNDSDMTSLDEVEKAFSDLSKRLELSIQKMKTRDIGKGEAVTQCAGVEPDTAEEQSLQYLKSKRESISLRLAKSIRLMKGNSKLFSPKSRKSDVYSQEEEEKEAAENSQDTPSTKPGLRVDTTVLPKLDILTEALTPDTSDSLDHNDSVDAPPLRKHSFETEASRTPEATRSFDMTEEAIMEEEVKAREAYISAMRIQSELLQNGHKANSAEMTESNKVLQACYARMEYLEKKRENRRVIADDTTPRAARDTSKSDMTARVPGPDDAAEPASKISGDPDDVPTKPIKQFSFNVSQDPEFTGEQERMARQEYVNALRNHQDLIVKRISPDTFAWKRSEQRQAATLAKLKYWEARHGAVIANKSESELKVAGRFTRPGLTGYSTSFHMEEGEKPESVDDLVEEKGKRDKPVLKDTTIPKKSAKDFSMESLVEMLCFWLPTCANRTVVTEGVTISPSTPKESRNEVTEMIGEPSYDSVTSDQSASIWSDEELLENPANMMPRSRRNFVVDEDMSSVVSYLIDGQTEMKCSACY